MSKHKQQQATSATNVASPGATPAPSFTHTALGTYKDRTTGQWYMVEIPFDPQLKEAGEPVFKSTQQPDRLTAMERFKIRATECLQVWDENAV
jgi:hypothetical protein